MKVICIETTKGSWLKVGMILNVLREDELRYYFKNGGVAAKRLFTDILNSFDFLYDQFQASSKCN